jgi:hypothetical protein
MRKELRRVFLFLPKRIGNEIRWFEHAEWEQEFRRIYLKLHYDWIDTKWLNQ